MLSHVENTEGVLLTTSHDQTGNCNSHPKMYGVGGVNYGARTDFGEFVESRVERNGKMQISPAAENAFPLNHAR